MKRGGGLELPPLPLLVAGVPTAARFIFAPAYRALLFSAPRLPSAYLGLYLSAPYLPAPSPAAWPSRAPPIAEPLPSSVVALPSSAVLLPALLAALRLPTPTASP